MEKLTVWDFIKGIFGIIGLIGLYYFFLWIIGLAFQYTLILIEWLGVGKIVIVPFIFLLIIGYGILAGFARAAGEGFGAAMGYRALLDLKKYFSRKK